MNVRIRPIKHIEDECLIIECVEVTADIESIQAYALTKGKTLIGSTGDRIYRFDLPDVLYFEAVDERVFAYTERRPYELKLRLYEVEQAYRHQHFIRCSKSFVINLMQVESISPALNGRFHAHMKNKEIIVISRQYVPEIKHALSGGR